MSGKTSDYLKLKELISKDKVLLLPHKKFKGLQQTFFYARCGMSQEYFEKSYINGDVVLQIGEIGPRIGYPIPWEDILKEF